MAGVIKQDRMSRPGGPPRRFSLGDFVEEGRQIVAAAREQARTLLAEARCTAEVLREQVRREAYDAGYQAGLAEGRAAGHQEALEKASMDFASRQMQLVSACESIFREVDRLKQELLLSAHRDLVSLAVAIAERVTKRIGRIDRRAVTDNLAAVIDRVGEWTDVLVEVNPVDARTLELFVPEFMAARGDLKHVDVRVNEAVAPGGCIVRTRAGRIDATLDTQLERIAEELLPGGDERSEQGSGVEEAGGDGRHGDVS